MQPHSALLHAGVMEGRHQAAAAPNAREEFERRESGFIAPFGQQSRLSKGRLVHEEPCPIRTAFQVDRDRIVFSNAFRRLKRKTQVFLSPLGDHYRTRLTHTLEVAEMARAMARAMRLNEDLAEAVALGHDLGHTPFGHGGETALKEIYSPAFCHNEQSLRVVDVLEQDGKGLNLTWEVRDGILKHSKGYGRIFSDDPAGLPETVEGRVVRVADIMAYLNHDLDDAIRSRVILRDQIPRRCIDVIGRTHSERAINLMQDLIYNSRIVDGRMVLCISEEMQQAMHELRRFLFHSVYRSEQVHREFVKAKTILGDLFRHFLENPEAMQAELEHMEMGACFLPEEPYRTAADLVASLTDRNALALYQRIFLPTPLV